ncbi:MAG: hypothetical protein JJ863_26560 [Deltaproteobacteria bacterium]|nr:hypothetical protein [Deltaproteobacteria bacterium]
MSRRKFLVLYRGPQGGGEKPKSPPSPEAMQAMIESYRTWMDSFADQIVDPGAKLMGEGRVLSAKGVADGPFVEAKEVIGGYMILSCESYDEAMAVMKAGPAGQLTNGSMEIRELIPNT